MASWGVNPGGVAHALEKFMTDELKNDFQWDIRPQSAGTCKVGYKYLRVSLNQNHKDAKHSNAQNYEVLSTL